MFAVIGHYRGVDILEDKGYFYPSSNASIEAGTVKAVVDYIDNVHTKRGKTRHYELDTSIIANFIQIEYFLNN